MTRAGFTILLHGMLFMIGHDLTWVPELKIVPVNVNAIRQQWPIARRAGFLKSEFMFTFTSIMEFEISALCWDHVLKGYKKFVFITHYSPFSIDLVTKTTTAAELCQITRSIFYASFNTFMVWRAIGCSHVVQCEVLFYSKQMIIIIVIMPD